MRSSPLPSAPLRSSRRSLPRWPALFLALVLLAAPAAGVRAADPPPQPTGDGSEPAPAGGSLGASPLMRERTLAPEMPVKMPDADANAEEKLDGPFVFGVLKKLAGEWEGMTAGEGEFPMRATWHVTAGGSALVETQFPGTDHEMVSVYHLDGDNLVLTHFCAMGNQPRMRFVPDQSTFNVYEFRFDGGTNVSGKAMHIHEGTINLVNMNTMKAEWRLFEGNKKIGSNIFNLARAGE